MKQYVMIELMENTTILEEIEGFSFDKEYGSVPLFREKLGREVYVFRGVLTNNEAKERITSLPEFYDMWNDAFVTSGLGFGIPPVSETGKKILGNIRETSKKEEFELFLCYCAEQGKEISFYQKWVAKMANDKPLPKPVFGKMVSELGEFYEVEENEETLAFPKCLPN